MAASLSGETPSSAPKPYVEKLFDGYAENFDHVLTKQLDYKTPKILTKILVEHNSNKPLGSVIDLGCGTGLFGEQARQYCNLLSGIDISESMLKRATEKNVYDSLHHSDLVQYLGGVMLDYQYL